MKCPLTLSHNEILEEAASIWHQETIDTEAKDRLFALDKEYNRRFGTHIKIGFLALTHKEKP